MDDIIGYYFIEDQGDGSFCLRIFNSEELATKAFERESVMAEKYGCSRPDSVEVLRMKHIETFLEDEDDGEQEAGK